MAATSPQWTDKQDHLLATTHRFRVVVEPPAFDLGAWNKVSGLGFRMATTARKELGVNNHQYQLLETPAWTPIVMTRAVVDSMDWAQTIAFIKASLTRPTPTYHLAIQMQNAWGDDIRLMTFEGARLTEWKGPSLETGPGKGGVAEESLTFIHDGLFADGNKFP